MVLKFDENGKAITTASILRQKRRAKEREIRRDFDRVCMFLNLDPWPELKFRDDMRGSYLRRDTNTVHLGLNHECNGDRVHIRQTLAHELVHALGVNHTDLARNLGFYSAHQRDTLSPKVVDWIFGDESKPYELEILEEQARHERRRRRRRW